MSLPLKSDTLEVVSGGAANPVVVAGTADPAVGLAQPEGSVYLRYGVGVGRAYVKTGPNSIDWVLIPTSGTGGTLDSSYDFSGAGAGRIITADTGAVQIDATTSNSQAALTINRTPGGASAVLGIDLFVNANANASAIGLRVTDTGSGSSIKVTKSAAGSAFFADLTNVGAKALEVTVSAAPTSVSPISVVANTTGTTAALVSISKIPAGATAGDAISVSMGANTTGAGILVSQAGTGAAIEVSSGSIQVANSAAAVSPSNQGRIRYNSGTQTFQVSLNGAAYVDVATGAGFTLDIGDSIGSSTVGSVLFVGAGNVLQQDNANFFWNDTTNSLVMAGGGFVTKTSADSAGFYNTAYFSATTYGVLTQADRELRVVAAANAGGQRYQYLMFNGRWSGNLDSPTLTQGLFDRVCGIEFAAAADSLGPNPNSSINFIVNTGTKGTGAELTVTPTRAMTITYTARVGIGTVNPSQVFDVEAILGNTNAKFGSALPVYVVSNSPSIGFNAYYNAAWKFGKGSSNHYGCVVDFNPVNGVFSILTPGATGNADANITLSTRFSVSSANVITAPGLASATIDAIVLGSATTGVLRVQVPTSPGFGYDYNNKRLTIGSHPAIMFATIDVTNAGSSMMSLRCSDAYSATSGSIIYLSGDLVPSASGHRLGGLTFGGWNGGGAFYREGAAIQAFAEGAWTAGTTHPSYVALSTTPSGGSVAVERLRITSAGLLNVTANATGAGTVKVQNSHASGYSVVDFHASGGGHKMGVGHDNALNRNIVSSATTDLYITGVDGGAATSFAHQFGMTFNGIFYQMLNGSGASVSAANSGRIRYNTTGQKFQVSLNGAAYVDLATGSTAIGVERLSVDGAASPTLDVTFVSGTGTDLTLADGTVDGFIKKFVVTGGTGTITPTNLADGNVLTWSASPANVSFLWDATSTTWHVYGNPYNMVTT